MSCSLCVTVDGTTYCPHIDKNGEHADIPEGGTGCDIGCEGLFVNGDTCCVERCDTCQRFADDGDAGNLATTLINLLYAVHVDCKAATVADALDELVKRA